MGIRDMGLLTSDWQNTGKSDGVERESSQEERERKDREKAEEIRERQIRLGHIPDPEVESDTSENNDHDTQ